MDYIIFGMGVGATLTLIGWSFRMWGPAARDRSSSADETVLSGYELVNRMAWQRFCRSCGAVLAMFGLLVLAVTIVATILTLSNSTGTTIVLATFVICLVMTLVWLGLFLHRFGARGIIRPRLAQPDPAAASPRADPANVSTGSVPSVRRGDSSVAVASETPEVTDTWTDTDSADAAPSVEASDDESPIPDRPYDDTGDEVDATASELEPEHGDILVLEEKPGGDEEETGVDAGYEEDHVSLESPGQVERPEEEEAETGQLIFRSAVGNKHPSVGSSAGTGVGIDGPGDDDPETEADVSDDQVSMVDDSDTRDDLGMGESPVREIDEERDTPVDRPDPEVPDSSGRAEAVRSLRQRRIRRLMREPSESE